jgi:hypothetical protein
MNIPKDKQLHLILGAISGVIAQGIVWKIIAPIPGVGIVVAYLMGKGKEKWDAIENEKAKTAGKAEPHTVEIADINATAIGGLVIDLLVLLGGLVGILPSIW